MEFDGKIWVSMTWERKHVHYMSSEPVLPSLLRVSLEETVIYDIFDFAYNSAAKTGRVFLMSEPDEDDDDEGPWSHEYVCKGEAPVMDTPYNGSLSTVRLRFTGR